MTDGGEFDIPSLLSHFFAGAGTSGELKEGKEWITGPVLGEIYKFDYEAHVYHEELGCVVACAGSNEFLTGTMMISFFENSTDVPVGPTAPLLAAGLAGLWLRKRKG